MFELLHSKPPVTTTADWFTLGAAVVAALAAIAGTIVAAVGASKARDWVGRDQWWTRFSWALEKSVSKDFHESELGLSVLIALIDVPWAKREDNEMAIAVADVVAPHSDGMEGEVENG
jgi:hypothetical protein